jgi:hypothetical protein
MKNRVKAFLDNYRAAILTTMILCAAIAGSAQVYQGYPQYGAEFKRIYPSISQGFPTDTFTIDAAHQAIGHIAIKNDTTWRWSTSLLRWEIFQGTVSAPEQCNTWITPPMVTYQGDSLKFSVSASAGNFGCIRYNADSTTVTGSPNDSAHARFDLIYADATGYHINQGIPGETPAVPSLEIGQLYVTHYSVPAASSTPTLSQIFIYNENAEGWTWTASGTTIDPDNAGNAYSGSKSFEVTNINTGDRIEGVRDGGPFDVSAVHSLSLHIKLKAVLNAPISIGITFMHDGIAVSKEASIPINRFNITTYQAISMPMANFQPFSNYNVDGIRIRYLSNNGTVHAGFDFDYMFNQTGIVLPGPGGGVESVNITGPAGWTVTGPTTGAVNLTITPGGTAQQVLGGDGVARTDASIKKIGAYNNYPADPRGAYLSGDTLYNQSATDEEPGMMSAADKMALDSLKQLTAENLDNTVDTLLTSIDAYRTGVKGLKDSTGIEITDRGGYLSIRATGSGGSSEYSRLVYMTGNYTVADSVTHIQVLNFTASSTITLPDATTNTGRSITISTADLPQNVSPDIRYNASSTLSSITNNTTLTIVSDGIDWRSIRQSYLTIINQPSGTGEHILSTNTYYDDATNTLVPTLKLITGTGGIDVTSDGDAVYIDGSGVSGGTVEFADSTELSALVKQSNIGFWGHSLINHVIYQPGLPGAYESKTGRASYNFGIAGNTSTQVKDRFLAMPETHDFSTVLWLAENNFSSKATVLADVATIVAALGHTRFLIISCFNTSGEVSGSGNHTAVLDLNTDLEALYPDNYVELRDYFVSLGTGPEIASDIPAGAYRLDNLHLTQEGYNLAAQYIYDNHRNTLMPDALAKAVTASDIDSAITSNRSPLRPYNKFNNAVLNANTLATYSPRGVELLSNESMTSNLTGWTSTNWTHAAPGATHNTGNTSPLSQSVSLLSSKLYQVEWTVAGSSGGTWAVTLGALPVKSVVSISNGTYKVAVFTTGSGAHTLSFTPTSAFNGTVTNFTVKLLQNTNEATATFKDTLDNILHELRVYKNNSFGFGVDNLIYNQSSTGSFAFGKYAGREHVNSLNTYAIGDLANQYGNNVEYGVALGYQAARNNRIGTYFTAVGTNALIADIDDFNTGIGAKAYETKTTGTLNTGVGYGVGTANLSSTGRVDIGADAGESVRADNSVNIGRLSNYWSDAASNGYITSTRHISIGYLSKLLARSANDQLAIGANSVIWIGKYNNNFIVNATGNAKDSSNVKLSAALEIISTAGGFLPPQMTAAQRIAISSPVEGLILFDTDSSRHMVYRGGAWKGLGNTDEQGGGGGGSSTFVGLSDGAGAYTGQANKFVRVKADETGIEYAVPSGIASPMWAIVDADFTLANSTSAQTAFPSTMDEIPLDASTTYIMEGQFDVTTGGTSHSFGMGFTLSGGASLHSYNMMAQGWNAVADNINNTQTFMWRQTTTTVASMTAAATTQGNHVYFKLLVKTNAAGTWTPQIMFSADPTGTLLMKTNSWITVTAIGPSSMTTTGGIH